MSEILAVSRTPARRAASAPAAAALDPRRRLQLALGAVWLLDGILQFQPSMFTKAFPQMLAGTSGGNPAIIASPINWSAGLITHHLGVLNAMFATIQVAIGLGIAWRPTARLALGASALWAASVWWLGEGLGGVVSGAGRPVNGAPGAVILYALLAVLLWPVTRDRPARFTAGRAVGQRAAQALWLVLWASLAFFAVAPAARAPQAISSTFAGMAPGQPGWLAWCERHAASLLAGQGLLASVLLAGACAVVAAGAFLPARATRATLVLAVAVAAFIWLAEGLGGIFTGAGTDPNSGPLLVLLALAFWPTPTPAPTPAPTPTPAPAPAPEGA